MGLNVQKKEIASSLVSVISSFFSEAVILHFEDLRKISHVLISEHQILCPFRNQLQIV